MRPWAAQENVKVIIGSGKINGTVFMEFDSAIEHYKRLGAEIHDGMTDGAVLQAIEDFENTPPAADMTHNPEACMAAAMEFDNLERYGFASFEVVKKDYDQKLWSDMMVREAVIKCAITEDEYKMITGNDYGGDES
jgi:hypothetical protein